MKSIYRSQRTIDENSYGRSHIEAWTIDNELALS